MSSTQSRTVVIVPAFNEERAISAVIGALRDYTVVVVDDGSSDDTAKVSALAGARVLRHAINRGQGAAIQTGIDFALSALAADVVVTFDADGQHDAADVGTLTRPIINGESEIVLGSRFLIEEHSAHVPAGRRTVLRLAVIFTRLFARARLTDTHNGLRAFSRAAAEELDLRNDRMAHASEIIDQVVRSGRRFVEVPVRVRYTDYSTQKGQRASGAFRVMFDYLMNRWLR